ncbi:uncharacterized protein LOC133740530 [Rosa rugosa]|uniref:uncharacterized protein LOC133740530 n=1 Tax=Rosa rugosa TaxID=74645 RepID=UPI002B40AFDB|nr:uncharacterized protein LOC133740530 [Rosa rugosa]
MRGEQTLPEFHHSNRDGSGSRRTRSQVAPDWTETDLLILVNEVTAVEADCRKEFSSFQKWKIVAQNCTALGVPRSLDQYRRKWEALLHDYKIIDHWNSQSRASASYWALESDRRKQFGLPRSFDHELFKAIGGYEKAQENQSDTEEGEAEADVADEYEEAVEPESKRRRRPSTQQKWSPIQNPARRSMVKKPVQKPHQTRAEERHVQKPRLTHATEKPVQKACQTHVEDKSVQKTHPMRVEEKTIVKPVQTHVAEKPGETHAEEKPRQTHEEGEPVEKARQTHAQEKPVEKPPQTHAKEKPRQTHAEESSQTNAEGKPVKNPPKIQAEENVVGKSCQTHVEGKPVEKPHQTHAEEKHVESCLEAIPMENLAEEKPHQTHSQEKPVGSCLDAIPMKMAEEVPQKSCVKKKHKASEEQPGGSCLEVIPMKSMAEKKTLKSSLKRKQQSTQMEEKIMSIEEQKQIMAMKLQWSAELIRAIVTENADHEAADEKSIKDLQADLVRRQGDQVIACLADIVKTLNQVHRLVQERK